MNIQTKTTHLRVNSTNTVNETRVPLKSKADYAHMTLTLSYDLDTRPSRRRHDVPAY